MKRFVLIILIGFLVIPVFGQDKKTTGPVILPMMKDGTLSAFVRFGRPKITQGLVMRNPEKSKFKLETFKGFEGVVPAPESEDHSLYFQVSSDQIITATGTFYVTIQYYDQGQGSVDLEYMVHDGQKAQGLRTSRFYLGNSCAWQQHSFTLDKTVLYQLAPEKSDFRIHCPDVALRHVAISRTPLSSNEQLLSPSYQQPQITTPHEMETAVFPQKSEEKDFWKDSSLLEEKSRLYTTWGVSRIVETISLIEKKGYFDFTEYRKHHEILNRIRFSWIPRFKIGDVQYISTDELKKLQKAIGTERESEGSVISLWEKKLPDLYKRAFSEMSGFQLNAPPMVILSFAGDWGPLMLSSEKAGNSGWPDMWGGDPAALRIFQIYLQNRYGKIAALNQYWKTNFNGWKDILPSLTQNSAPLRKMDTVLWYQTALIQLANEVMASAKQSFPRSQLVIELTDDQINGSTDLNLFSQLAARYGASILLLSSDKNPTVALGWQLLADNCRRNHVPFGLRIQGGKEDLLGSFYALSSEGGTMLFFNEDTLAQEQAWPVYKECMQTFRISQPRKNIAVIYPRTSILENSDIEFKRILASYRERFAFDLIDERDLAQVNPQTYPLVICPWGHTWDLKSFPEFTRIARNGAALMVSTDAPWQTLDGNGMEINEQLFAVRMERKGNSLVMVPRNEQTTPYSPNESSKTKIPPSRRMIDLGATGDDMFLQGEWSPAQNKNTAKQLGFSFPSFRWVNEKGSINVPMKPNTRYQMDIQGYLPKGKQFSVFVNQKPFDRIQGKGEFVWHKQLPMATNSRNPELDIQFRGNTWKTGEILGTTQTVKVGMAVSKVAIYPIGEKPPIEDQKQVKESSPDFNRGDLRRSWLREIGKGMTLLAMPEYVSQMVFEELIDSVIEQPDILTPRFRISEPPDGEPNNTYVSPLFGGAVYMNFTRNPVVVQRRGVSPRQFIIPPGILHYVPNAN